jgi:hypothetical protein
LIVSALEERRPHKRASRSGWFWYWIVTLVAVALVEGVIIFGFIRARSTYQIDSETCMDECIDTWFNMLALGGLAFVWPLISLLVAIVIWGVGLAVGKYFVRSADQEAATNRT